jgi:hypothetical protein
MSKYQITDHDRAFFAKWGKYPLRSQILMHRDETGDTEGASIVTVLNREIYGEVK